MRKNVFILLMLIGLSGTAQNWQWARAGGGVDGDPFESGGAPWESVMEDMATDKWGNVYAVGMTYNDLQFTGTSQTFPAYGPVNACIVKYDKCGNFQWAIVNGDEGSAGNSAIAIDSDGYIYVGGWANFNEFAPFHVQTSLSSDSLVDNSLQMTIMKYDPNGNLIWMEGVNEYWRVGLQGMKFRSDGKLLAMLNCGSGGSWQSLNAPVNSTGNAFMFAVLDPQNGNILHSALIDTLPYDPSSGINYYPYALDANDNIYLPVNMYNFTSGGQSFPATFFGQPMIIPPYAAMLFKLDKNLNFVKSGYDDNGDAILSICYSEGALYSAGGEYSYCNYLGDTVADLTTITAGSTEDVYRVYKLDTGTLAPIWESSPQFENSSVFESYIAATSQHVWMSASNLGETIWNGDTIYLAGAGVQQYLFKFDKTNGHCDTIYVDSGSTSTAGNLTSMITTDAQENVFIGGQFASQFTCGPNTLVPWGGSESPIFYIEKFGIDCSDSINTNDAPYPPANLVTTTGGATSINLVWTDASPYRISFHIYRSPNGVSNWQLVDTVLSAQTTLVDTGLTPNTWYWYKVAAWNTMGESDYTNIDSAETAGSTAPNATITGPVIECANTLTGINYSVTAVAGNTYAWAITGGSITSGAGTNSVTVTWNSAGPYKLKITECDGSNCASDSVGLTVNPVATSTISQSICQGQSFDGFTTTGTFVDTFTAVDGCDSIRTLHLTVLPVNHSTLTQSICPGQSYLGHNQTGTYTDTINGTDGCDSIRTLNLTVLAYSYSTITHSICPGQSYLGHNQTGTYNDTLTGSNGCDSIRTLNLTLLTNPQTNLTLGICQGSSYDGHNTTGTYVDTFNASNGCDSIRTLHLTVSSNVQTTISQNICAGQSFDGFTQTGNYIDTFTATGGCDSIRTLNLTVLNNITSSISQNICAGQQYGGHSTTGTFIDTLTGENGCDSIRTLHLTVLPVSRDTVAKSICAGQSYAGHSAAGTYIDTLNAENGCDSIRTLHLAVLPLVTSSISDAICAGQSYGGHTSTGTYVDTFTAVSGCDSIRTLTLTVTATITTTVNRNICQGQSYAGYTSTGTYVDSFTAVGGCDSIRTLQLTVNPLYSDTFSKYICQGDTFNGHSVAGFYTDTLVAITSCDSMVTLHLFVTPVPGIPTITQQGDTLTSSVAYSYQWYRDSVLLSGDTTRNIIISQNGNYSVLTGDSAGCSNISSVLPVMNVGISSINSSEAISIFPNPAHDELTFEISTDRPRVITIEIVDVTGNLVIGESYTLVQGSNTRNIDISQLAAGYYEASVISNGLRNSKPIVKF